MTRAYANKRLAAMHSLYGLTPGKLCGGCYYWHMGPLLCEEAPAGKRNKWGANWVACGWWQAR